MLDTLLTRPETTETGTFWTAHEARNLPGCVQKPRVPFGIAATGPRGLSLAATHGQAWITTGGSGLPADDSAVAASDAALTTQLSGLDAACVTAGRDPGSIQRILLTGFTPEKNAILSSLDRFVDFAGRHVALGFDELVIHWPVGGTEFEADPAVFETIATQAPGQLR